nr:MAG TPA: hypothetical protein [Caudoviricetes sp.]
MRRLPPYSGLCRLRAHSHSPNGRCSHGRCRYPHRWWCQGKRRPKTPKGDSLWLEAQNGAENAATDTDGGDTQQWSATGRKGKVMNQHKVKPTPQIIVSALFNSVYNAEDEEQMNAATSAMVAAIKTLADYDIDAAELFIRKLYRTMMKHEYTRFGIERTSEEFVKLGLEVPKE